MANRVVLHIAGQTYNMLSDESVDYMNEVAELAHQTVMQCGGSDSFTSTVTLADDYIKAKAAAEAAEAKCRALEDELAALREQKTRDNGKRPNNHHK